MSYNWSGRSRIHLLGECWVKLANFDCDLFGSSTVLNSCFRGWDLEPWLNCLLPEVSFAQAPFPCPTDPRQEPAGSTSNQFVRDVQMGR